MENGIQGENCAESEHANPTWCKNFYQPLCVDRTIRCNNLQRSFGSADAQYLDEPNSRDHSEWGTRLQLTCLEKNFFFDFSVPDDLISFYYSNNINITTMYCNKDRYWVIENGAVEGETCESSRTDAVWCKNVVQPMCVDRTIRCNPLQPMFWDTDMEMLKEVATNDHREYGTSIRLTCPQRNYFFDFSTEPDLISYYYSNNINDTVITCNKERYWAVERGGVEGETCLNSGHDSELWCRTITQPMCHDRTIRCSPPPEPLGALITYPAIVTTEDYSEYKTTINYRCPGRKHAFGYPVGPDFVSYYYTVNIKEIEISCNKDGSWVVTGGQDGLTCANENPNPGSDELWCGDDLSIPDCEDRTVYCSEVRGTIAHGERHFTEYTGPGEGDGPGKFTIKC